MNPVAAIHDPVRADRLPLERLADNLNVSEGGKTREVARQFEAILLRQILQSMHQTAIKGALGEASVSKDIYFDLMNEHLADTMTKGGGLGLASALQVQLQRQMPGLSAALAGDDEALP